MKNADKLRAMTTQGLRDRYDAIVTMRRHGGLSALQDAACVAQLTFISDLLASRAQANLEARIAGRRAKRPDARQNRRPTYGRHGELLWVTIPGDEEE